MGPSVGRYDEDASYLHTPTPIHACMEVDGGRCFIPPYTEIDAWIEVDACMDMSLSLSIIVSRYVSISMCTYLN